MVIFFSYNDIYGLLLRSGGGYDTFGNSNYPKGHKNPAAVSDLVYFRASWLCSDEKVALNNFERVVI